MVNTRLPLFYPRGTTQKRKRGGKDVIDTKIREGGQEAWSQ